MREISSVKRDYASKLTTLENSQDRVDKMEREAKDFKIRLTTEVEEIANKKIENRIAELETGYKAKEVALASYVGIFGVITAVTTVLSFIRNKAFIGDFIRFWVGFWNVFASILRFVHNGVTVVAGLCEHIPQQTVAIILYWVVLIVLWGAIVFGVFKGVTKLIKTFFEPISDGVNVWNTSISVILLAIFVYFGDFIKALIAVNLLGLWLILTIILIGVGIYINSKNKHRIYY